MFTVSVRKSKSLAFNRYSLLLLNEIKKLNMPSWTLEFKRICNKATLNNFKSAWTNSKEKKNICDAFHNFRFCRLGSWSSSVNSSIYPCCTVCVAAKWVSLANVFTCAEWGRAISCNWTSVLACNLICWQPMHIVGQYEVQCSVVH